MLTVSQIPNSSEGLHRPLEQAHEHKPDGQAVGHYEAHIVFRFGTGKYSDASVIPNGAKELVEELCHPVKNIRRALGIWPPALARVANMLIMLMMFGWRPT